MSWDKVRVLTTQFQQHEQFTAAVEAYTVSMLDFRRDIRDVSKLLAKEERFRAVKVFIYLNFLAQVTPEAKGVGFGFFQKICMSEAGISDRTSKTVLDLLRHFEFVQTVHDEQDARRVLYVGTDRLDAYVKGWLRPSWLALAHIDREAASFLNDPQLVVRAGWLSGGKEYVSGSHLFFDDVSFARVFGMLEGGSIVVKTAIASQYSERYRISRAEIADSYNISKAQVSNVVSEGRLLGLFEDRPEISATAKLIGSYQRCVAMMMAFCLVHRRLGRLAVNL